MFFFFLISVIPLKAGNLVCTAYAGKIYTKKYNDYIKRL